MPELSWYTCASTSAPGHTPGRDARHDGVAGVVVQGRQHLDQRDQRVRRGAAEDPGVHREFQGPDPDGAGDLAAQRGGQRRPADGLVAHVGDDKGVTVEHLGVGVDEILQVADGLLLALDENLDADRDVTAQRLQGAGVDDQSGLVVGGAATVDPAVRLGGGDERVGVPALLRRGRLHVVVRVQQHRRRAGRRRDLGPHGRDSRRGCRAAGRCRRRCAGAGRRRPRSSGAPARRETRGTPPRGSPPARPVPRSGPASARRPARRAVTWCPPRGLRS